MLLLALLLSTACMAQKYSNPPKPNTTYTNNNPLYTYMYRMWGTKKDISYEDYWIGKTDANGKFNGWCQRRNFREKSAEDDIGYFRNDRLYSGYHFQYYYDEPENTEYSYIQNGEFKNTWKVKQGELFATLKAVGEYGRKKEGVTPLSRSYGSKFFSYSGRTGDNYGYDRKSATAQRGTTINAAGGIAVLAAIGAAIWTGAKAIDDADYQRNLEKDRKAAQEANTSKGNVEIVEWGTLGALAISHAMVQLRNRNNYDVIVTVSLFQDGWSDGEIIYSDGERSEYLPGVHDDYSTSIKLKPNSIRKVYLKADGRGRPTHIRIKSVR